MFPENFFTVLQKLNFECDVSDVVIIDLANSGKPSNNKLGLLQIGLLHFSHSY